MPALRAPTADMNRLAEALFTAAILAALSLSRWASAQAEPAQIPAEPKPATSLGKVIVSGQKLSDTDLRRNSTAAKMVFGREELDRYGDSSLGEVLKRLPGVTISGTPGRGGDIRMRGLGRGYTLILINGEPAPRGFSLDALAPEQVERIEIMRSPVAEHSARAIAGTINIVLREEFVKRGNEARPTLGWEQGRAQPGVSVQRGDSLGSVNYNIAANLMHKDLPNESVTRTTATSVASGEPILLQSQQDRSRSVSDGVHLNARLNWRLDGGDTFSFQPFLMSSRGNSVGSTTLAQSLGALPPPYANASSRADSSSTMVRGMGNLKLNLGGGARLDLRVNVGRADSDNLSAKNETDAAGGLAHTTKSNTGIADTSFSNSGKYSLRLAQDHQVAAGWELEWGKRSESAYTIQDGINVLAAYGDSVAARTRRLAAYVQDEWDIDPLWSAYGGLRWEGIRTDSATAIGAAQNQSSVLSPLLHSVWRFTQESKDQLRLGFTRSYRAPTLANLVAVPSLSPNYPAAGGNTPTSPDSVGNPKLKPELATGLDLAYEHYFSTGGLTSASLFWRNIDDLMRKLTTRETVIWSPQQRWVSTQQNFGHAVARGLELEAKFRLDELVTDARPISLRSNYSRYWSGVAGVPGPNNRLDQQPRQTANLGVDYRWRGLPLTLGGNLNWTPAFVVQQTDAQLYYQGNKKVFDVYALWKFDPDLQLRVSLSNLSQADYETANRELFFGTDQIADTVSKTFSSLAVRLEVKF